MNTLASLMSPIFSCRSVAADRSRLAELSSSSWLARYFSIKRGFGAISSLRPAGHGLAEPTGVRARAEGDARLRRVVFIDCSRQRESRRRIRRRSRLPPSPLASNASPFIARRTARADEEARMKRRGEPRRRVVGVAWSVRRSRRKAGAARRWRRRRDNRSRRLRHKSVNRAKRRIDLPQNVRGGSSHCADSRAQRRNDRNARGGGGHGDPCFACLVRRDEELH